MRARASAGVLAAGFIACSAIFSASLSSSAADTILAPDNPQVTEKRLGSQEEQGAAPQAIDQLRREANSARPASEQSGWSAGRGSDSFDTRLGAIERALATQQKNELDALQSSNRTVLVIAGVFAGIGFVGVLFAAMILARAMNRLAEIATAFPGGPMPGTGRSLIALGAGDLYPVVVGQAEQPGSRFIGAIERLEKRIGDLEHTAQAPANGGEANHAASPSKPPAQNTVPAVVEEPSELSLSALRNKKSNGQPGVAPVVNAEPSSQVAMLIGKGQALLNLGQAEDALGCFEKAVALDQANADALVKRGMALEKLQKLEEAIDSYDRAIAANGSMTLAYLFKGAACNRLQRFREALECYEKALTT